MTRYELIIVDAGSVETIVCVSRSSVTGYELRIVDAGCTEISTLVSVICGKVEVTVLYNAWVPAGSDVVTEIISV